MSINTRAGELAQTWENGNRADVAHTLESEGVDAAALAMQV